MKNRFNFYNPFIICKAVQFKAGQFLCILALLSIFAFFGIAKNKASDILGNYMVPSKDASIKVYERNGKYYGQIVTSKKPDKLDVNNPEKAFQKRKVLGLVILNEFVFDNDDTWEDGTIYDPKNGKTYSCKITRNDNGDLNVRGYIGFSLLGRTEIFTKIKN